MVDKDEFPRFGSTIEGMQKLKPAFTKDGTVTAGNASGSLTKEQLHQKFSMK